MRTLIAETTKEEREQIVADALGSLEGACDGCAQGITNMYQDYIDGKMELREVNQAFTARYVRGNAREDGDRSCPIG